MLIVATWQAGAGAVPTKFTLANSPDPIPMTDFAVNGSRRVQTDEAIRAVMATLRDRGNRKTEVSFNTTILWADNATAEAQALMWETQFPQRFNLTLTAGAAGKQFVRYLADAVMEAVSAKVRGSTTTHSYRIVGGVMSTSLT